MCATAECCSAPCSPRSLHKRSVGVQHHKSLLHCTNSQAGLAIHVVMDQSA